MNLNFCSGNSEILKLNYLHLNCGCSTEVKDIHVNEMTSKVLFAQDFPLKLHAPNSSSALPNCVMQNMVWVDNCVRD